LTDVCGTERRSSDPLARDTNPSMAMESRGIVLSIILTQLMLGPGGDAMRVSLSSAQFGAIVLPSNWKSTRVFLVEHAPYICYSCSIRSCR